MDAIFTHLPRFLDALWLTLWMFVLVTVISTLLGLSLAVLSNRFGGVIGVPMRIYSWVFRAVPELVVLLACYLALPYAGIDLGSIGSALLGLTLIGLAFQAEIFRACLASIDPRMIEAAQALGMNWWMLTRRVVLPQVIRSAISPWATFLSGNVKAFALASAVAVTEIMTVTRQTMAVSDDPFTLILFAALLYGLIASALMVLEMILTHQMTRRYGPASGGTV